MRAIDDEMVNIRLVILACHHPIFAVFCILRKVKASSKLFLHHTTLYINCSIYLLFAQCLFEVRRQR